MLQTTDNWAPNALEALDGHAIPIERLGVDDLDAMTVDWAGYDLANPSGLPPTKRLTLRLHQSVAVDAVTKGFADADRGKLIMACGTGKTFTALRIAEQIAGAGGSVLFLDPSIALVAQSLKEWTAECEVPIRPFAVCSDATTGNQAFIRPALIVSDDRIHHPRLQVAIVVPGTTAIRGIPLHLTVAADAHNGLESTTDFQVEQIRAVSTARLIGRLGRLGLEAGRVIDEILAGVLALDR